MPSTNSPLTTQPSHGRGERLFPSRTNRLHWHLTCLRTQIEQFVEKHVQESGIERIVDFGCGNMPYRKLIEHHVKEYIGCDLSGNELADLTMVSPNRIPLEDSFADALLSRTSPKTSGIATFLNV